MYGLHSTVLSSFVFLAIVQAGYNIDDTNTTIRYTGTVIRSGPWIPLNLTNENGMVMDNGSLVMMDYGRLFNQTLCELQNNPNVSDGNTLYWQGSGITVYGIVLNILNFTVSIDENPAPPPDLMAPPLNTAPLVYNTSLYDLQSLPLAFHFLTITLVDWISGDPNNSESLILFDYAHVNDTSPSPNSISPTSSTVDAPSSTTPHNNSTKKIHSTVGIALGTTIGAMVVCAVVVFSLMRRHKTSAETTVIVPFVADTGPIEPPRAGAVQKPIEVEVPAQAMAQSNTNQSITSMILTNQNEGGLGGISSIQRDPVTSGTFPDRPTSLSTGARLTGDQTEFVHSLYSLNVPAPAIAQVMQRMMTGTQDTSGSTSPEEIQHFDVRAFTAPPSYEAT